MDSAVCREKQAYRGQGRRAMAGIPISLGEISAWRRNTKVKVMPMVFWPKLKKTGKPHRVSRQDERRDCLHYYYCAAKAAKQNLAKVPCKGCHELIKTVKQTTILGEEVCGVTSSPCRNCNTREPGCYDWCPKLPQNQMEESYFSNFC